MVVVYKVMEILLVLTFIGFLGSIAWMVMTALKFKTNVVERGKRLAERPTQSVKNLIATGKGIAQQETVRAKRVAAMVKQTAGVVKETAGDVKEAVQTVHPEDLKAAASNVQDGLKAAVALTELLQSLRTSAPVTRL